MADINDNSTLLRFPIQNSLSGFVTPIERGCKRHLKYFISYLYLADQISEQEYFGHPSFELKVPSPDKNADLVPKLLLELSNCEIVINALHKGESSVINNLVSKIQKILQENPAPQKD